MFLFELHKYVFNLSIARTEQVDIVKEGIYAKCCDCATFSRIKKEVTEKGTLKKIIKIIKKVSLL